MNIIEEFVLNNTRVNFDIIVESDEVLIKAKEVMKFLGIQNCFDSTKKLDADEKCMRQLQTASGIQECTMLTEMGLYRLLMRSNKPAARPFQKWVCGVIKKIRQHQQQHTRCQTLN